MRRDEREMKKREGVEEKTRGTNETRDGVNFLAQDVMPDRVAMIS